MNEKYYMLWLSMISSIKLIDKLFLLDIFGSAEYIYKANKEEFNARGVFNDSIIERIIKNKNIQNVVEYSKKLTKNNISFVSINEEEYPNFLKHIAQPPIVLYYKGMLPSNIDLVSVVGTRKLSSYGENITRSVTSELVKAGIGVVSGLALGADTIAHEQTLAEKGYTIAVLGNGIDVCYPKVNFNLMNKIAKEGLILSEYSLGTPPIAYNFPRRNRIVAGLSRATIITEAPLKSGALITANIANDEGRDVLTVPADIFRYSASGNNELIKNGAIPIINFENMVDLLDINTVYRNSKSTYVKAKKSISVDSKDISSRELDISSLTVDEKTVFNFITYDGADAQYLSLKTGFEINKVQYLLTMLELNDMIKKLPEQKFIRNN